jgi:thiamine pyrophosphate-dependent acetolactate synthase large subunit-like protein
MEMEIEPYRLRQAVWDPARLGGLPGSAARQIAEALAAAKEPLLITGYAGRNHAVVPALVALADTVKGLRVMDAGGSDMCFPANHPAWLGLRYGVDPAIKTADVIVVLDGDVPWIHTLCKPRDDAKIFHIDLDPLKQMMPLFYIDAIARYRADALTAIQQVTAHLKTDEGVRAKLAAGEEGERRWEAMEASYRQMLEAIAAKARPLEDGGFGTGYLCAKLRELCPEDTIWAVEAVTNTVSVHDNLQPTLPGSWINCGGGGLGWSGGGALGIKLATDYEAKLKGGRGKFVVQIVGDGTYLFSVPGSVYWISKRYNIPVLTIILNNKGAYFISPCGIVENWAD